MKKFISVFLSIFLLAMVVTFTGCSSSTTTSTSSTTSSLTTIPVQNLTSPMVTNFSPENGATGVAVNQSISVTFTLALNPSSVDANTFTLMQGTTPVAGTVSYYGKTALFKPLTDLSKDTLYTALISNSVMDLAGNTLPEAISWTFTTGEVDTVAPYIVSTIPSFTSNFPVDPNNPFASNNNVPVNDSIIAFFNEAMDPSTINTSTFTLMQGTTPVAGTVNFDGFETAIFTPLSNLSQNTGYIATITTGATCLGGNTLAQNFVWSFTTGPAQTTVPMVVSMIPSSNATSVATNSSIVATFSEAINPMTINGSSFTLMEGTTLIPGTVSFDGVNTAVFDPLANLDSGTTYTVTITSDVTDLGGIHMASNVTWSFTTGQGLIVSPTVAATDPTDGATGIAANAPITITFSEGINPTSIVFALQQDNTAVIPGTITFDPTFSIVTFTPSIALSSNTMYTATVSGWDLGSYGMATKTWSFTTAP